MTDPVLDLGPTVSGSIIVGLNIPMQQVFDSDRYVVPLNDRVRYYLTRAEAVEWGFTRGHWHRQRRGDDGAWRDA